MLERNSVSEGSGMMHDLSTNIADNPHWEIQGREQ